MIYIYICIYVYVSHINHITQLFSSMLYPSLHIKALLRSRDGDPGACAATAAALRELRRCCGTLRPRWGNGLTLPETGWLEDDFLVKLYKHLQVRGFFSGSVQCLLKIPEEDGFVFCF